MILFCLQKRVLAYPNGVSLERAVYIWGENLDQLLESATQKLNLWKKAQIVFTSDGKLVSCTFDALNNPKVWEMHLFVNRNILL